MLLVDDYQPQIAELNFLLEESMRPNDQLGVSLRDVPADFALAVGFERSCQQHDAISGVLQNPPRGEIMLLGKNLRGRHERNLAAILDGDNRCLEPDNRFPGSHIAL